MEHALRRKPVWWLCLAYGSIGIGIATALWFPVWVGTETGQGKFFRNFSAEYFLREISANGLAAAITGFLIGAPVGLVRALLFDRRVSDSH